MSPRSFALLLAMTSGIGGRTVARVVARNALLARSPEEFLALSPQVWQEDYRMSAKAAAALTLRISDARKEIEALERRLNERAVSWVTAADAHYPQALEAFDPDPPGVLFLHGNHRLLDRKTFCVLSSRNASPAQLELIGNRAEEGVLAGDILVTGHDRPEYQRSAIVPLRWGAPRVLCLDRGLFTVLGEDLKNEAFRAARLWRYEFDPLTDLAISPFRPDSDFAGVNNKVRDRLVAGLSRRLEVVHLSPGGNMERLMGLALKIGRPVQIAADIPDAQLWVERGAGLMPNMT